MTNENVLRSFIECLPIQQFNVCAVDPIQINWLPMGTVDNTSQHQCWPMVPNDQSGFAVVHPAVRTMDSGQCTVPGNYYAVVARKDRSVVCPLGRALNFRYDKRGRLSVMVDPSIQTKYGYHESTQSTQVTRIDPEENLGHPSISG